MKLTTAFLGLALLLTAAGCTRTIDGKTARALVTEKNALLLDVRTGAEFKAKHIEGAVNIPVEELQKRLAELPDKDRPIVLYCRSGRRSADAQVMLKAAGFAHVDDLGGINNW